MNRLTKQENGSAVLCAPLDEAVQRLCAYENALEELLQSAARCEAQLAPLRAAGKEKTYRYKELLAQKKMDEILADRWLRLFDR